MKLNITITKFTLSVLMIIAIMGVHVETIDAGLITISNAGFDSSDGGTNPANHNSQNIDDWTQETGAGTLYIDNNNSYKPASHASPCLYLGAAASALNQDLSHNWAVLDVFTLSLIGQNPTWNTGGNCAFKVQLRQASDDTVLWDSGGLDVTDTVTSGAAYTGTGHIFSWDIPANAFATGTVGEAINIRLLRTGDRVVYVDYLVLSVVGDIIGLSGGNNINVSGNIIVSNSPIGTFIGNVNYSLSTANTSYSLGASGDNLLFDLLSTDNTMVGEIRSSSLLSSSSLYNITISADNNSGNTESGNLIIGATGSGMAPLPIFSAEVNNISGNRIIALAESSSGGDAITYSLIAGRTDLISMSGANLVVDYNSTSKWGGVGSSYYVTLNCENSGNSTSVIVKVTVSSRATGTIIKFN